MRSSILTGSSVLAVALAVPTFASDATPSFEDPVRLKAGGEFINVDIGHAAPFMHDFDGDGVRDLLIGQFGDGKLRIYQNTGTDTEPKYRDFDWFKADHEYGTVPSG